MRVRPDTSLSVLLSHSAGIKKCRVRDDYYVHCLIGLHEHLMRCNDVRALEVSKFKLYIFSPSSNSSHLAFRVWLEWAGERISLMLEIDKTFSAHSHLKPHT